MRWKLLILISTVAIATSVALTDVAWFRDKRLGGEVEPFAAISLMVGGEQAAQEPPRVGTNLDGLAYWSTATPFLDLMKSSSGWLAQGPGQWDTKEKLDLDEHGWVRSLPTSGSARYRAAGLIVLRDAASAAPPRARYVILYDGEGTIGGMEGQGTRTLSADRRSGRVLVQAADNGALHLTVTATDPKKTGNYIRNIRIVREDRMPLFERGETFNPDFLRIVAPFSTFRFMDWMSTNRLYRSDGTPLEWRSNRGFDVASPAHLSWADRPMMTDALWNRGVPVEAMVELANRTGAEPWFNMPVNASDDYVRGFATSVLSRLDRGRTVHVELSNEVWNWSFVQAKYAEARAKEAFGAQGHWMEWYGKRSAEVGAIWNRAFDEPATGGGGPNRVRIVYGTQLVYKGLEKPGLETRNWKGRNGNPLRAADYFDEYAVTGYYGAGMSDDESILRVSGWWNDADGGFSTAIRAIATETEAKSRPLYRYHAGRAKEHGLDLVTYESGFGERTPNIQAHNQKYTDFLIDLQRRPEIHAIEMANYNAFRAAGGKLYMNFGIIGKPSRYGSWSALEAIDQANSPRYQALLDMITLRREVSKPKVHRVKPPQPLLKQSPKS